jgi:uncharacterized protein with FMN-binding domain
MRRAVVVLGSTVAGLAALFSYKTHVAGIAVASTAPATPTVSAAPMTPSASPSPSKTTKKPAAKKHATAAPTTSAPASAPPPPPTTSAPPPKPSGNFTGPLEDTQYGAVQVQITVSNGKITSANGSLPQGGSHVGQDAMPQLNQEVLTVQSAQIQGVSGATYTSQAYMQSLQHAIDQAGL